VPRVITPGLRSLRFAVVLLTLSCGLLAVVSPAVAGSTSVSKTSGLNPAGDRVTVSGSGFDVTKGIYVAVCVDRGAGVAPSPCLGGVDTGGSGGGSAWISSNPPAYGAGLATPYGPGGSFTVTLSVVAHDPVTGTDCTVVRCAAVTRADHTRAGDRSQDTRVGLSFAAPPPPPAATSAGPPPRLATTVAAPGATPSPAVGIPGATTAPASTSAATTPPTTTAATGVTTAGPTEVDTLAARSDGPDGFGWWPLVVALAAVVALVAAAGFLFHRNRRRLTGSPPPPVDRSDPSTKAGT